jgi:hypothetical protein
MHIIEYEDLDTSGLEDAYAKTLEQLRRGDWKSAQVKKLAPTDYYRARLDHSNRLLFKPMRYGGDACLLMQDLTAASASPRLGCRMFSHRGRRRCCRRGAASGSLSAACCRATKSIATPTTAACSGARVSE